MSHISEWGTRVWYEASDGVMFAGVSAGLGSIPGTVSVFLCGAYWQWKSSPEKLRASRRAHAIALSHLATRTEVLAVDDDWDIYQEATGNQP